MDKPKVLVAKCLSGEPCRYHGEPSPPRRKLLDRLQANCDVILVCPEQLSGLPTPRPPSRWRGDRLIAAGQDVTEQFLIGAAKTLRIAQEAGATKFYGLKFSPSCDPQRGITCRLLTSAGIRCIIG